MVKKIKYAVCRHCKKEIEHPIKRPMDSMEKTVWAIIIICTLGIGVIFLLIYNKKVKKKDTCPTCYTKLVFSERPYDKPKKSEPATPREMVLEKVEGEKEKTQEEGYIPYGKEELESDKIYCPYCGEPIKKTLPTCPNCQTALDV